MPKYDVVQAVNAYIHEEPDQNLRQEALALLRKFETGHEELRSVLEERFLGQLSFGTAGIRAQMESGFNRLNKVSVAKIAFAIGSFLLQRQNDEKDVDHERSVVVGYDGRLKSAEFAKEITRVLTGLGFRIFLFDGVVPTPVCAFGVTELGAMAGVMVTASHNPPQDNGIKVYTGRGAQIVSPDDQIVEGFLKSAPPYRELPQAAIENHERVSPVPERVLNRYFEMISLNKISKTVKRDPIRVVYTALHGVGFSFIKRALLNCPFVELHPVKEQKNPDGNFPTVKFPNPEEKGALDLAFAYGEKKNADLILANDPDADRVAVALRVDGRFKMLSGNELGAILGCDVLENLQCEKQKLAVSTLVSSRLLSVMAKSNQSSYAESLTGFSKIAQIAFIREAAHNEQFVYGFEEALGYCVGDFVRDKDGICAAIRLLERAALLKAQGVTLWDELERIAIRYGLFRNIQWSFRFSGTSHPKMESLMSRLRQLKQGETYFDGRRIESRIDLLKDSFQGFPRANVLIFKLSGGMRIVVRPSGTEPKIKFYAEICTKVDSKSVCNQKQCQLDNELLQHRQSVESALEEWID